MLQESQDIIADMVENGRIEHIFSTPVFSYVLKSVGALNGEIRDLVLERERTTPSMVKSNQGGWQSSPDFFEWGGPVVATLEHHLRSAVKIATARLLGAPNVRIDCHLYGWAAVNRHGHYNTPHVHPLATWSGVYYVDAGDEAPDTPGAALEFAHPVVASAMTFFPGALPSARLVRPETGMIILFPSYLQHNVRMYQGTRPRISVPFNAQLRSVSI